MKDSIGFLARGAQIELERAGIPNAHIDLLALLEDAAGVGREKLLVAFPERAGESLKARLRARLARRVAREPLAYIIGRKEFYASSFKMTPAALIARPETEGLIEKALDLTDPTEEFDALDLGTGSGAIGITLLIERPSARLTLTDISESALELARENHLSLAADRPVEFVRSDLFENLAGRRFDLILSNPPYLPESMRDSLEPELTHEPPEALFAGAAGLDLIAPIIERAGRHLNENGSLLLEIGADQTEAIRSLLAAQSDLELIAIEKDLSGLDRIAHIAKAPER